MDEDLKIFLNSDYTLADKFKSIAPSTFKHCQDVASMVEAIAKKLDLPSIDRVRCAALFHDIGKMDYPEYFSENQTDSNPHDNLSPYVSYQIIANHVARSVSILVEYGFPADIIKMVQQHHGNSVVRYFYMEARKADKKVSDELYRYKHKTPETIEAAILMICDVVEATAKALFSSDKLETEDDKKKLINDVMERLKLDKQIDLINYGQERIIVDVLLESLNSIYHKRPVYQDQKDDEKNEK